MMIEALLNVISELCRVASATHFSHTAIETLSYPCAVSGDGRLLECQSSQGERITGR
jgi:hypothetical protein